jgi:hypothetical protein
MATINVHKEYDWTSIPRNSPYRNVAPYVKLSSYKITSSAALNRITSYLSLVNGSSADEFYENLLPKSREMQEVLNKTRRAAGSSFGQKMDQSIASLTKDEIVPLLNAENNIKKAVKEALDHVNANPNEYNSGIKRSLLVMDKRLNEDGSKTIPLTLKALRDVKQIAQREISVFRDSLQKSSTWESNRYLMTNLEKKIRSEMHNPKHKVTRLIKEADQEYAQFAEKFGNINKILTGREYGKTIHPGKFQSTMAGGGSKAQQLMGQQALDDFFLAAEQYAAISGKPLKNQVERLRFMRDNISDITSLSRIGGKSGKNTGKSLQSDKLPLFLHPELYVRSVEFARKLDDKFAKATGFRKSNDTALKNIANRMWQFFNARTNIGNDISQQVFDFIFKAISDEELQ